MPYPTIQSRSAHFVQRRPIPTSGPAVIFVHGAGGSHQHWLYQVRDLPGLPTFAVDLPGHGRSEGPGRDSITGYGDWLFALLDAAGLDEAVIVGHSMGGAIAMDVALRFPSRVAGLGLVGTGARLRVAPAILDGLRQDPEAAVRLIADFAFGPDTPPETVRLGRVQMSAVPVEVILGDFGACDDFDVIDRLGDISTPTLVLCGTKDQLTPPKYSTYLRDHIEGAQLCLVEGAGHMVMVERPGAVAQALSSFLAARAATG